MFNKDAYMIGCESSIIRELFEYSKNRKEIVGDNNVFDFSIGNPSVLPPKELNNELINLLKNEPSTVHQYTSNLGDPYSRECISNSIYNEFQYKALKDDIYLTCGAESALAITIKALAEYETNEFIVFAPYFPDYLVFIKNTNAKVVIVNPNKDFYPDLDDFKSKITKNTKGIILNSPNNPTGKVYNEELIKSIVSIIKDKEIEFNHPIYLISDEPYRDIIYDDLKHVFIPKYFNNTIITYSLSKTLSIPGERIGYIQLSNDIEYKDELLSAIKGSAMMLGYIQAPSLLQKALPKIIKLKVDINEYKENRDLLYSKLSEIGFKLIYPEGAFYMMLKCPIKDENKFEELLKKNEIILVPSRSFGIDGYYRIAYCVKKEVIINSIKNFKNLFDECEEFLWKTSKN